MPLSSDKAVAQAKVAYEFHEAERAQLDVVRRYWKGRQKLPAVLPAGAPSEVRIMARSSRVNVLPIVVNSLVQSAFVDGFRAGTLDNLGVWDAWQRNRMDARQTGIHRAAAAYGASYAIVLPGDPVPVIRGKSPRSLTVLYGEDPDWPMSALERCGRGLWKLYDEEAVYYFTQHNDQRGWEHLETRAYAASTGGVTPIVRFLDEDDLDDEDEPQSNVQVRAGEESTTVTRGQVVPLIPLQDQIDLTTFDLQIAQHYGAFKQRYIIGWAADNEKEAIKSAASTLLTLDEDPESVKLGEFAQSDLDGYIKSREASLRHAATLSQTPVHELIGELVNLSAEALAAAEAGKDRKVGERKTLWGESHEQILGLVGHMTDQEVPADAQVVWRDTTARAFAATIDGLGKVASLLGVPPQELWERVPGVTQQDIERWKAAAEEGDAFSNLAAMLDRQANVNGDVPAFG